MSKTRDRIVRGLSVSTAILIATTAGQFIAFGSVAHSRIENISERLSEHKADNEKTMGQIREDIKEISEDLKDLRKYFMRPQEGL